MAENAAPTTGQAPAQSAGEGGGKASAPDQSTVLGTETPAKPDDGKGGAAAAAGASADGKPAGDGKTGDDGKAAAAGKAPDTYKFEFKDPAVQVDQATLEAFSPVLKKHGVTQEQAQEMADVLATQQKAATDAFTKQLGEDETFAVEQVGNMLAQQRDKWAGALKSDKDIGGQNYETNVKAMQRAIARFGSPELKQLLNGTGLGNHPALAKFCLQVGLKISEDAVVPAGGGGGGARKSNEDVFYGDKSA